MGGPSRRTRALVAGIALCLVGLAAFVVPLVASVRAHHDPGVKLTRSEQRVSLPPDARYGVYVTDDDNSGYSESCSARETDGGSVRLEDPPAFITFGEDAEWENLDHAFDTGSGDLTFDCVIQGESVALRPVPADVAVGYGFVAAAASVTGGLVLARRGRRRERGDGGPPAVLPAVLTSAIGGSLVAVAAFQYLAQVAAYRIITTDPDAFGDGFLPEHTHGSTSTYLWSTLPDQWPVPAAGLLVAAAWVPALRGRGALAWVVGVTGCALAAFAVLGPW